MDLLTLTVYSIQFSPASLLQTSFYWNSSFVHPRSPRQCNRITRKSTGTSGVTRNSGAPGQISKSSPHSPFPTLSPLLLTLPSPSRPWLPSPSSPSLFPTLSFPSPPSYCLITARGYGGALFCAIHSAKSAKLLKVSPTCTRRPCNTNSCFIPRCRNCNRCNGKKYFFCINCLAWNSGDPLDSVHLIATPLWPARPHTTLAHLLLPSAK